MRYLAIDHGDKRIGLALCDKLEIAVRPLPPIINKEISKSIENIGRIIDHNKIEGLVIGIPLGDDNEETQQSIKVRFFTDRLDDVINIPIEYWNETYSTQKAIQNMIAAQTKQKTRKKLVDSYAAAVILREFLDNKKIKS